MRKPKQNQPTNQLLVFYEKNLELDEPQLTKTVSCHIYMKYRLNTQEQISKKSRTQVIHTNFLRKMSKEVLSKA